MSNTKSGSDALAIGSFAIALIGVFFFAVILFSTLASQGYTYGPMILTGGLGSAGLTCLTPLWIIGIVLGAMGLPSQKRGLATLGLIINGLIFLLLIGYVILFFFLMSS